MNNEHAISVLPAPRYPCLFFSKSLPDDAKSVILCHLLDFDSSRAFVKPTDRTVFPPMDSQINRGVVPKLKVNYGCLRFWQNYIFPALSTAYTAKFYSNLSDEYSVNIC